MQGNITWSHFHEVDLSFNPLGDHGLSLFFNLCFSTDAMWEGLLQNGKLVQFPITSVKLKVLTLQDVQMGSKAITSLTDAMQACKLVHLTSLSIGANDFGCPGMQAILDAIANEKLQSLSDLLCPLSNIGDLGLSCISAALSAGFLDNLFSLDICDVGANSHSINQLARIFEIRYNRIGVNMKICRLKMFGMRPFPGKSVRDSLSREFIAHVQVS